MDFGSPGCNQVRKTFLRWGISGPWIGFGIVYRPIPVMPGRCAVVAFSKLGFRPDILLLLTEGLRHVVDEFPSIGILLRHRPKLVAASWLEDAVLVLLAARV